MDWISSASGRFCRDLLADLAGLQQRGVAGRDGPALEVAQRTLVGEDVLDPQLGGVGVRRVLHDALRVVRAVDAVGRDDDLGGDARLLELGLQAGPVVRPVEVDRRLAGQDRGLGDLDVRMRLPGLLELGEELDARHDVVEAAAVGQRRRHHGGEGRAGLTGIAVDRRPGPCTPGFFRSAKVCGGLSTRVVLVPMAMMP